MTMFFAFAAPLPEDGRLDWGGDAGFNRPREALLPTIEMRESGWATCWRRLDPERRQGRVIDGAAIALKLDSGGLRSLIEELFVEGGAYARARDDYRAFADAMSPQQRIAFIAYEI
jgi:hypothetical protein